MTFNGEIELEVIRVVLRGVVMRLYCVELYRTERGLRLLEGGGVA